MECKWLPELIDSSVPNMTYSEFIEQIYAIFLEYYLDSSQLFFLDRRVSYKKHPQINDRHHLFYHLTTSNYEFTAAGEDNRLPNIERCERIKWPKAIIENYLCIETCECQKLKVWRMKEKNEYRIKILFEDFNYLVVLAERSDYYLIWTGFHIDKKHRVDKYKKQYSLYEQLHPKNS